MTKEEAIKWLIKPAITSTDIGEIKEKEIEAYNMAVEALKADTVDVEHDLPEYCSWSQTYTNMVQSAMADMKSADAVSVVIGRWQSVEVIDDDAESGVNDESSKCSVCGHIEASHYWTTTYYKYCPNCGAKMKGGDDE